MFRSIVLSKKKITFFTILLAIILAGSLLYSYRSASHSTGAIAGQIRTIHMVTGEFKSTTADGKEIEAYRWDPGTIFIEKGETVNLSIRGINGESHPFFIEGTDIKGEVLKNKETVVTFKGEKEGTHRLICLTHPDKDHNGPMIAYLVVD